MVDLCISGTLEKDVVVFSIDGEVKTIDQFSRRIHFTLEENKTYRVYFEQTAERFVPRYAEILLNILFMPVRGVFNVLTFNIVQDWEKDISAFKLSGYIDINLNKETELIFELRQGKYEKDANTFRKPTISFSTDALIEQSCSPDAKEIRKKHQNHLLNIGSASAMLFALLFYLLFVGYKNKGYIACILTACLITIFSALIVWLILRSFKDRKTLLKTLTKQQGTEHN